MSYAYHLLPGGYVDETGVHRGVPPTQEDFDRIALNCAHRRFFAEGRIEFMPVDPFPQPELQSSVDITMEMPIEEARKRWPNTSIKGEENDN